MLQNQTKADAQQRIRVLLVDDHPFVLEGLRVFLQTQPNIEIVGEATDAKEAIQKAQALQPSVILMDITMPKGNGFDATRQLRVSAPESKVLILTVHEKWEFASQAIEAGAFGYLTKSSSPPELMRALEAVHRGDTFFAPELSEAFLKEYVDSDGRLTGLNCCELSVREREVLTLIAEGWSNKEASSALGISVRTVEKHRERIMAKLNLRSVVDLTRYAVGHGFVQARANSTKPVVTPACPPAPRSSWSPPAAGNTSGTRPQAH